MDELQRQFFEGGFPLRMRGARTPTTDVYTEEDNRLTIEAHLPDFDETDVNISLDEGALVIQADKHEKSEDDKKKNYVVRESSTSYYRRIALPDQADQEKKTSASIRGSRPALRRQNLRTLLGAGRPALHPCAQMDTS